MKSLRHHSKICLSTSWKANLALSSCDCAAKYLCKGPNRGKKLVFLPV